MKEPARDEKRLWVFTTFISQLIRGRTNATGTVTATAGATSTVVIDALVNDNDAIFLSPTTANAAAEVGAGTAYVSAVQKGQFTLTHANAVSSDRTFRYLVQGG